MPQPSRLRTTATTADLSLRELPVPDPAERVVFVTNAVRRPGGLRTRAEQQHHRPVLAVVVR